MPRAFTRSRLLLGLILAVGFGLRLWGIGFASSTPLGKPDEETFAVEALAMFVRPCDRLANGWPDGFFGVWHAVLWLERAWYRLRYGAGVNLGCLLAVRPLALILPVRLLSAALGTVTAWVVGRVAATVVEPERANAAALWATAIYAVNALVGRDGHFGVSDATLCLEIAFTLLCCAKAVAREPWWLVGAALCAGLAFGTKYSAAALVVPCAVAAAWTVARFRGRAAAPVACALVAAAAGVLVLSPHIPTHWEAFRAGLAGHLSRYAPSGAADGASGLVFYATIVFPRTFGWPGFLLCLAGLGWCLPRRGGSLLAFYVLAFSIFVLGPLQRVFWRYGSPLVPALAAAGGIAAAGLVAWLSARVPRRRAGLGVSPVVPVVIVALLALAPPAARLIAFDRLLARADTRDLARDWLVARGPEEVVLTEGIYAHVHAIDANLAAVCRAELPSGLWRPTPILAAPATPVFAAPGELEWPAMVRWRSVRADPTPVAAGAGERGWERIGFLGTARYLAWERDQRVGLPEPRAPGAPDLLVSAVGPRAVGLLAGQGAGGPREPACWSEVARFSPGEQDAAEWDVYDAFFVPSSGLERMQRPGPDVTVYENRCKERGR